MILIVICARTFGNAGYFKDYLDKSAKEITKKSTSWVPTG